MPQNLPQTRRGVIPDPIVYRGTPELVQEIDDWTNRLRAGSSRIADADSTWLRDAGDGKYVHALTFLTRAIRLSVDADTDEAAYALPEAIEAIIAARRTQCARSLEDAICHEDKAQHAADDAVRAYSLSRDPARLIDVRETAHAHAIALEGLHHAASCTRSTR